MKLTELERERLKRAFKDRDKPLAMPKPVPKLEKKKRGRPAKGEE